MAEWKGEDNLGPVLSKNPNELVRTGLAALV